MEFLFRNEKISKNDSNQELLNFRALLSRYTIQKVSKVKNLVQPIHQKFWVPDQLRPRHMHMKVKIFHWLTKQ